MKIKFRSFTLAFVCCIAALVIAGCQRDNKTVQAAAESTKAAPVPATESSPNNNPGPDVGNVLEGADRSFIMQAEKDNIQGRYLGRMAQEKSQNKAVQAYGKLLSHDNNTALQKLVDLMDKYGVAQPKALPEERKDAFQEVKGLSGPAFDRKFLDLMVKDHEKAIAEYQHQAAVLQNKDLKNYAQDQIPVLQTQLNKAKALQSAIESNSMQRKG